MQAPSFWHTPPHAPSRLARLLSPLSAITRAATAKRIKRPGHSANCPVICIGNLNVGGTGKTPTVMSLATALLQNNYTPHILSRGYGGALTATSAAPICVDPKHHTAHDVGDEPLLLAAFAPTWVGKNRAASARLAEAQGADVLLLDDGFQNPALHKDISIIVVDAHRGFGNGRLLPAGPLREPIAVGLARADALLSIGPDQTQVNFIRTWGDHLYDTSQRNTPLIHISAQLEPLPTGMPWAGLRALAFAGIGNPNKFFQTLVALGVELVHTEALSDHQPISPSLLNRLKQDAHKHGAQLVTTEKDAIRLPAQDRASVLTLPVRLMEDNTTDLSWECVLTRLKQLHLSPPQT